MRDSFVLFTEHYNTILEDLTDEEVGKITKAIFLSQITGEEPVFEDRILSIAYKSIFSQVTKTNAKYDETVAKRSEAGKKAASAKQAKRTNVNERERTITNVNEREHNDNVNDNDNVYDNDSISPKSPLRPTYDNIIRYSVEKKIDREVSNAFYDHYSKTQWKDGKGNPIGNWMHLLDTWQANAPKRKRGTSFNKMIERDLDIAKLEMQLLGLGGVAHG